jgi:hypothetical protein
VSTLREPEAEALMKGGMARPVGKGRRIRCLMLNSGVPRRVALTFLHYGARMGSPSRTVTVERVGPKRQPVYVHLDRSFGFGGTESLPIVSRPALDGVYTAAVKTEPVVEKGTNIVRTLGGPEEMLTEGFATCEQLPAVDNSCAVIPDERGSDEGKEPERVPVEPETPDVAVPAKPAQHIREYYSENITSPVTILAPDPSDISALRKLGAAVLVRAFEDARTDSRARQWFEQTPQPMLTFWCQVVGLDVGTVRKRALEAVKQNGKMMKATT